MGAKEQNRKKKIEQRRKQQEANKQQEGKREQRQKRVATKEENRKNKKEQRQKRRPGRKGIRGRGRGRGKHFDEMEDEFQLPTSYDDNDVEHSLLLSKLFKERMIEEMENNIVTEREEENENWGNWE